jgi:type VI secretion system protein ImpM
VTAGDDVDAAGGTVKGGVDEGDEGDEGDKGDEGDEGDAEGAVATGGGAGFTAAEGLGGCGSG